MAPTIEELERMSDSDVRQRYNEASRNVSEGLEWWREELHWRRAQRQARTLTTLTLFVPVMTVANVALVAVSCAECEARWLPADKERWQAWLTDDEPPELAFYCPECAEREFGGEKAV